MDFYDKRSTSAKLVLPGLLRNAPKTRNTNIFILFRPRVIQSTLISLHETSVKRTPIRVGPYLSLLPLSNSLHQSIRGTSILV